MEWVSDVLVWLVRSAGVGAISFLTQRILANAQESLDRLRSKSQMSVSEKDMEELLTHFEDEVGSFSNPEADSGRILKLQTEISIAFWIMRIQSLTDKERSKAD